MSSYCNDLTNILETCNIPYTLSNLVEVKWRVFNLDFDDKTCKHCGGEVAFVSLFKGFPEFCSGSCRSNARDKRTYGGFACSIGWTKSRNTLLTKHGVNHQLHIPEIFERQQANRYKTYTIKSPTNKEYRVQGYERYVFPYLWEKFQEDDLIIKKAEVPRVEYYFNNKIRKYYPDGFIRSLNTIVEVKSTFTIKDKTLISKLKACESVGYIPVVYLYDNGKISKLTVADVIQYVGI